MSLRKKQGQAPRPTSGIKIVYVVHKIDTAVPKILTSEAMSNTAAMGITLRSSPSLSPESPTAATRLNPSKNLRITPYRVPSAASRSFCLNRLTNGCTTIEFSTSSKTSSVPTSSAIILYSGPRKPIVKASFPGPGLVSVSPALSPATLESDYMHFLPGRHIDKLMPHKLDRRVPHRTLITLHLDRDQTGRRRMRQHCADTWRGPL